MRRFAALYDALDRARGTNAKVDALAAYLREAPPADAAWAVALLIGRRPKRLLRFGLLLEWTAARVGIPEWLVAECRGEAGDFAETMALLLEPVAAASPSAEPVPLHRWMTERLPALGATDEAARPALLDVWIGELSTRERFLLVKILSGAFRVGVAAGLVGRALARVAGVDKATIAARLMGDWSPSAAAFERLVGARDAEADPGTPYPFYLAHPLEGEPAALGDVGDWQAEWKWDGIRAQLIRRDGRTWIWSRGEELVTERFPEVVAAAAPLPDGTVLDGELLGWRDAAPLPFADLQTRIGRKVVGDKARARCPVALLAYDLLEADGDDWRARPLAERRARLVALVGEAPGLLLSPAVEGDDWAALAARVATARERGVEGLMLKRRGSPYRAGRPRGDWWKWKVEPLAVDLVLTYAQKGSGRRASRYTDYTFGAYDDAGALVTVAKAYSGLTDEEIEALDKWVRRHAVERYGPVLAVEPVHVFELRFDDIQRSSRHKSKLALRFPRIGRWRTDKPAAEAATLAELEALLASREAQRAAPARVDAGGAPDGVDVPTDWGPLFDEEGEGTA